MKYVFSSILKDVISGFLKEKRSLGFDYKTEERYLRDIDKLALSVGLKDIVITKEFVQSYTAKKAHKQNTPCTNHPRTCKIYDPNGL